MNTAGADEHSTPAPRPTRDWRWALGVVGRCFIVLGLLILAFVAYQLWGTGIEFRANQADLAKDFRRTVATAQTSAAPTTTAATPQKTDTEASTVAPAVTTTLPSGPRVGEGDVLAALKFPTLSGTTLYVVSGVRLVDLKRGVGHYPGTALPGQYGNASLAGHRTTYGAPFEDIDRLKVGDPILIDTADGGHFEYIVDSQEIIRPENVGVLAQPEDPKAALLTLTTCHPKRSTKRRLIVRAHLNLEASSPVGARTKTYATTTVATTTTVAVASSAVSTTMATAEPDSTVSTTVVASEAPTSDTLAGDGEVESSDATQLAAGWFKDTAAWPHIILWGLLLTAIAVAARFLGVRFRRRILVAAIAAAPFVVVLYFFFQNINRLLPPGL